MGFEREFTLRDYHAENLLWLPEDRIGLLDFQDAVIGWDAWDLAMLTQDARREVSAAATDAVLRTYLEESGKDESALMKRLAVIGTLNALRIAGVFARLVKRDGKPRYNDFMPRQQLMLARNLKHPGGGGYARLHRRHCAVYPGGRDMIEMPHTAMVLAAGSRHAYASADRRHGQTSARCGRAQHD